ncbi:hypothetical protein [Streptomyces sp. NPDC052192]|uniref:hypothetical protein n=1 Tax=Streptomyces sp. NPDC052192 TaxID=3155052 RepID=UPI003422C79B
MKDIDGAIAQLFHENAVANRAIGVLLVKGHLTPTQAQHVLEVVSCRTEIEPACVAALLLEWARTDHLHPHIRDVFEQQLAQCQNTPRAGLQGGTQ